MMSGVPLETCRAFNKLWNNKFYYKAASCWYFYWVSLRCTDPWASNVINTYVRKKELCVKLVIYKNWTEMHGQQNIKFGPHVWSSTALDWYQWHFIPSPVSNKSAVLNNCGPMSACHKNYFMRTTNAIVFPLWRQVEARTVWIKLSL